MKTVTFHDLRHTCATLLLANGLPDRVVSQTLGHASVSFTLDRYTHPLDSIKHDAAERMDRLLG